MEEKMQREYEIFGKIPIGKYWNYKRNFGPILNQTDPQKRLASDMGRSEMKDLVKLQIGLYFIGRAHGVNGYIGGGSTPSLRSYALAWKQWIIMWPFQSRAHKLEFDAVIDEVCLHFDVGLVQPHK